MLSLGASRGQPQGCVAAGDLAVLQASFLCPGSCRVRLALEAGDQRPQSAGAGHRGPRASSEMWSTYSPRAISVSGELGLGAGGGQIPRVEVRSKTQHIPGIYIYLFI